MITTDFLASVNKELASDGLKADIRCVKANNDTEKEGITLLDVDVSPVIYPSDDMTPEQVASLLTLHLNDGIEHRDLLASLNKEKILASVMPELVATKTNKEYLEGKAQAQLTHDITIIYRYIVDIDNSGIQSIVIPAEWLPLYNINLEELFTAGQAFANEHYKLRTMREVFLDMGMDEEMLDLMGVGSVNLYCLTNEWSVYGASSVLSAAALGEAYDRIGGDFYIIPSSIHEVLIIPTSDGEASALADMIQSINDEHVKENEVLGNHAYMCDGVTIWNP